MKNNNVNSENQVMKYGVKPDWSSDGTTKENVGSENYNWNMKFVEYLESLNGDKNDIPQDQIMMDNLNIKNKKTSKANEGGVVNQNNNSSDSATSPKNAKKKNKNEQNTVEKRKVEATTHDNTGAMGLVILNPANFKNGIAQTKDEIKVIEHFLKKHRPNITPETKEKLISALKEGKLAFAFNKVTAERVSDKKVQLTMENSQELLSLTQQDVDLLLKYAENASNITDNDELLAQELNLRKEYFQNHRVVVPEEFIDDKKQVLSATACKNEFKGERLISTNETTVTRGAQQWVAPQKWNSSLNAAQAIRENILNDRIGFTTVKDKGVNPYTDDGTPISNVDRALAEHASNVASDMSTTGQCFTGLKHSLFTAGVIKNYGLIRDENGNIAMPKDAIKWFQDRPEMFTEIKYTQDKDGQYRKINSTDLYDLPAGYIILYSPEDIPEHKNEAGHACITNGHAQTYGDHTDRLHWEDFEKGEHGTFHVFKLNDKNWKYNEGTQKVEYIGPKTSKVIEDNKYAANRNYRDKNENAKLFQNALVMNKDTLMQELNITEDEFNFYKSMAQAISVVETQAGDSNETKILDKLENIEFVNKVATKSFGPLSAGMTQIKATILSDKEKEILKKLGVSTNDMNNLDNPEKSALATVVHIQKLEQDYPKYLTNNNIGIIKDKSKLSDDETEKLNSFINTITNKAEWNKLLLVKDILKGGKTASTEEETTLVEGAKIFVDTHVDKLTKEEYIAARWNGKTRTKPSDLNKTKQLNRYYDNMLQVYIDRARIAILNGKMLK